jgi:preprotein translocase subunit SecE
LKRTAIPFWKQRVATIRRVESPSADEVRRSVKATLLGVALGVVLFALSRAVRETDGPLDRGRG